MLRDYQLEAIDAIWRNKDRHIVASLPTGAGKSHVIADLCRKALHEYPGARILVVAHVKELLEQNAEKIRLYWSDAPIGIYCAGLNCREICDITVASIQSIYDIGTYLGKFDFIIVDEAHRIPHGENGMYHILFRSQPQAKIIGLTATPYRLGGGMLHRGDDALFDDIVCEIKTGSLIERGYLSPIRAKVGSKEANLESVHTRGGEFIAEEMAAAFDDHSLTMAAVNDVLHHAKYRNSIMVFCCSVAHCHNVAGAIASSGIQSISILTGETNSEMRAKAISEFKSGRLRFLINCDVLTTGFDAPNTDCIVLLRATKSPGLYVQMLGRGLRNAEGKTDCLLLDYGGNVERHGPIDSITVERIETKQGAPKQKACPECREILSARATTCSGCGYVYQQAEPKPLSHSYKASSADPIFSQSVMPKRWQVLDVRYFRHKKEGKPDSMRVQYTVCEVGAENDFQRMTSTIQISEWVCFEHEGYARRKAEQWSKNHMIHNVPSTVELAMKIDFFKPKFITTIKEKDFTKVNSYEF